MELNYGSYHQFTHFKMSLLQNYKVWPALWCSSLSSNLQRWPPYEHRFHSRLLCFPCSSWLTSWKVRGWPKSLDSCHQRGNPGKIPGFWLFLVQPWLWQPLADRLLSPCVGVCMYVFFLHITILNKSFRKCKICMVIIVFLLVSIPYYWSLRCFLSISSGNVIEAAGCTWHKHEGMCRSGYRIFRVTSWRSPTFRRGSKAQELNANTR